MTKPTIILVNDTDHLDYPTASVIFGILNAWDIPFTHATFYTLEKDDNPASPNSLGQHCYEHETASFTDTNRYKYISLLNHQIKLGNEIAYHGYSQISNTREKFLKGIEKINESITREMATYIEHGGNPLYHPTEGCKKETLAISGKNKKTDYYVADAISEKFQQSWCYFDLVNPKNNIEKEKLIESLNIDTFYEKEKIRMMKRYRAKDAALLINGDHVRNSDVLIAYTHFGYKGYPPGTLLESWSTFNDIQRNCQYLAS